MLTNAGAAVISPRLVTLTGWDLKSIERSVPEAIERVRQTLEERRPAS